MLDSSQQICIFSTCNIALNLDLEILRSVNMFRSFERMNLNFMFRNFLNLILLIIDYYKGKFYLEDRKR